MCRALKIILTILIIMLVTVLLFLYSSFGLYLFRAGGNVSEAFKSIVKDVVGDQNPIFVLVLGVSEDISVELTDTIMLVGYNPDNNQAFVLSIPRDTFIGIDEKNAGGFDKINALYQKNPKKTVEAVENLTGIKIDHYVTIKTSVLVDIVNAIGGVYFDVPINMDYDDTSQDLHIHLKAGLQKIDGDKAEQLVRFRHNNNGSTYSPEYGDNDEGRMRTQREFLKVVAQQVIHTKSVEQIKQVVTTVFDNLVTNITLDKIVVYIPYAIDINLDEIEMNQLPGSYAKLNSLWFYKVDQKRAETLIQDYIEKIGLTDDEKKQYLKEKTTNKSINSSTNKKNKTTTSSNTTKNKTNTNNNNTKKNSVTTKNKANITKTTKEENNNTMNTSVNNTTKNTTIQSKNEEVENSLINTDETTMESKKSEVNNDNLNSTSESENEVTENNENSKSLE